MTAPLPPQKPAARYAFEQIPASAADDDLFVCLTFSGGGTRAAAFSYGVLQKLRDTAIVRAKDGRHESLLDEVDCISSVSGGSFTAAYYALFGARIFQDYRKEFLIELLRDRQRVLEQAQADSAKCQQVARDPKDCPTFPASTEIHVVDVGLDAVADPARRARLLAIGTSFSLTPDEVKLLIDAAGEILDKNPDFQNLLAKLR